MDCARPVRLTWRHFQALIYKKETLMETSTPLIETGDAGLIARAYNLGLKLVPNMPYVLTRESLEYWESHLKNLKAAAIHGFSTMPIDPRFVYVKRFSLTVPLDYVHATQLATFERRYREGLNHFNSNITDAHFSRATAELIPGKTYIVNIFGTKETVTSEDCLNLLRSQKALLVGAQGASLVYQEKKEELPRGKCYASFDEKKTLWVGAYGNHRVPLVYRNSGGDCRFNLGVFEDDWNDNSCVLCFCDGE